MIEILLIAAMCIGGTIPIECSADDWPEMIHAQLNLPGIWIGPFYVDHFYIEWFEDCTEESCQIVEEVEAVVTGKWRLTCVSIYSESEYYVAKTLFNVEYCIFKSCFETGGFSEWQTKEP